MYWVELKNKCFEFSVMESTPNMITQLQAFNGRSDTVLSPLFSPLSFSGCADGNMTKRQKIVKEIFESEQTYISQLSTIVTLFLEPIRVSCLLPPESIMAIFNNIEGILAVNTELLRTMRQHSVGEAFTHLGPFMKLYSSYSSNYQNSIQTLEKCTRSNSNFAGFIETQESRPECCFLNLQALLITPIQRIPRYKLLLEDLLRHTKATHLEYSKLNAATQQIEVVASHMNDYIRQLENSKKMLALQKKFTGSFIPAIIAPGRQFVKEGRLMKICKRKPKERVVFLFSDMLLYARPNILDLRTETFTCRGFLPLLSSEFKLLSNDIRVPGISALFQIISMEKSVTFFSYVETEVMEWIQLLRDTTRELQESLASFVVPPPPRSLLLSGSYRRTESTNHSFHEMNLETTYPLTPGTPISNLAEPSFFLPANEQDINEIHVPGAPETYQAIVHSQEPIRTISGNLRELDSMAEDQGLMEKIEEEINLRHRGKKQLKKKQSKKVDTVNEPMSDSEEPLSKRSSDRTQLSQSTKEDSVHGKAHSTIKDNNEEVAVETNTQELAEHEERPLLENERDQDSISHHLTVSSTSVMSGNVQTKCCVIL